MRLMTPRTQCGRPSWPRRGRPSSRATARANSDLPGGIIIRLAWILRTRPFCGRIRNMRRVLLPASGPRAGLPSNGSDGWPSCRTPGYPQWGRGYGGFLVSVLLHPRSDSPQNAGMAQGHLGDRVASWQPHNNSDSLVALSPTAAYSKSCGW